MRDHSWDVRLCQSCSERQFALMLRDSGITDMHYMRMSMEDRVGERGAVNIHSSGFLGNMPS